MNKKIKNERSVMFVRKKYRRAKQEEGRNTFNGLRHSQHMFLWRLIEVLIFIAVVGAFIILVQSKVEGNSFNHQVYKDRTTMLGKSEGNFSMCNMTHSC